MTKFTINQSLIKQMYRQGDEIPHCPQKIHKQYIIKSHSYQSATFDRGNYFEYLAIGAGAINDYVVTDLPRLKNGNKSLDQIRIEEQAMRFKSLLPTYGMQIVEVQKVVTAPWVYDDDITLRIVIDFLSPIKYRVGNQIYDYPLALMDLKLTQNIHNNFGDYSWGFPANMDHLQAILYSHVWEENYGEQLPWFYWVFDYKKNPENKLIRKKVDNLQIAEMHESIRKTQANLLYYEAEDWPTNPSIDVCKSCALRQICTDNVTVLDNVLEV